MGKAVVYLKLNKEGMTMGMGERVAMIVHENLDEKENGELTIKPDFLVTFADYIYREHREFNVPEFFKGCGVEVKEDGQVIRV
jgi:hypothetical protein